MVRPRAGGYPLKILLPIQIAAVALFLGCWQWGAESGALPKFMYSSPAAIWAVWVDWWHSGELLSGATTTVEEALLGYLIGAGAGIVLALVLMALPRAGRILQPFIVVINAMPRLTLVPFFIIWLGFGLVSKLLFVAFLVVFMVFFNVYTGLGEVNRDVVNNARVLGARWPQLLIHVYLPAVLVWLTASLRASIGFAFAGAVVGEYIGSQSGLGWLVLRGLGIFDTTQVFAGLGVVVVVVMIFDYVLRRIEASATLWQLD